MSQYPDHSESSGCEPSAFLPRESMQARKRSRTSLGTLAMVLGVCFACAVTVYFAIDPLTRALSKKVPLEYEKKLADFIIEQQFEKSHCDDAKAVRILEQMGQILLPERTGKFSFRIHKDKEVNAFTLPGDVITFNTGLFKNAKTSEEIAGIMGHEIQHVLGRHVTKRLIRKGLFSVGSLVAFGDVSGFFLLESFGQDVVHSSFDRSEEHEADRVAIHLLDRAKISRQGFADFFQRILNEDKNAPGSAQLISTHPENRERLARVLLNMPKTHKRKPITDEDWNYLKNLKCKSKTPL